MKVPQERATLLPNGLELCCPAEAGSLPVILAHKGGPGAPHYDPARRVSFSELLDGSEQHYENPMGVAPGTCRSGRPYPQGAHLGPCPERLRRKASEMRKTKWPHIAPIARPYSVAMKILPTPLAGE